MEIDPDALIRERNARLLQIMAERDVQAGLTSNPSNILDAAGSRDLTVFSLMGPFQV